jgi:hypothetical protein
MGPRNKAIFIAALISGPTKQIQTLRIHLAETRRRSRAAALAKDRRETDQADRPTGRVSRCADRRPVQVRPLPVLIVCHPERSAAESKDLSLLLACGTRTGLGTFAKGLRSFSHFTRDGRKSGGQKAAKSFSNLAQKG